MSTFYDSPNDYRNYLCHYGVKGMKRPSGLKYKTRGGKTLREHRLEQARKTINRDDLEQEVYRHVQDRRVETEHTKPERERQDRIAVQNSRREEKEREEEIRAEERRREEERRANSHRSSSRPNTLNGLVNYRTPHSRTNPGNLTHLFNKKRQEARSRGRKH